MSDSAKNELDKNDKAIQIWLNGQFKEMRDRLGDSCRVQKIEVACMPMGDSITNDWNNRPVELIVRKNLRNSRRLAQIADQE